VVNNRFDSKFSKNIIELKDTRLLYIPNFLTTEESSHLFSKLLESLPFESGEITLFGKTYSKPRLEAFFAENNLNYSYSGQKLTTRLFPADLLTIKSRVEEEVSRTFNALLVNLYRDGNDSNGWHSDNEKELGPDPIIASLSLGAARKFEMQHKQSKERFKIILEPGSLLIMLEGSQFFWRHQLPKDKKVKEPRINLTFRKIY
jgi:alkylated DNA repair dioxygenase AlkB